MKHIHTLTILIALIIAHSCTGGDDDGGMIVTRPKIKVIPDNISFDYLEESKQFFIINEGIGPHTWNWDDNSNTLFTATPSSGVIMEDDTVEVTIVADRSNLGTTIENYNVLIENQERDPILISIQISNYEEEKWVIDKTIVDAEYDKNSNTIIAITDSPTEVLWIDVTNKNIESIPLDQPSFKILLQPGGKSAFIQHKNAFSVIDLDRMSLDKFYPVSVEIYSMTYSNNGWVYINSARDGAARIVCVNLSTGEETLNTGDIRRGRSAIRLNPSGDYLYATTNGLSNENIEKYDVSEGIADHLYHIYTWPGYPLEHNLWIPEPGNRVFMRGRSVFSSSDEEASDFTYLGELSRNEDEFEYFIEAIDFSHDHDRIYAVLSYNRHGINIPNNEIRTYEFDSLNFLGDIHLPDFFTTDYVETGKLYSSQGQFVFSNKEGTEIYAIVRADLYDEELREELAGEMWAIVTNTL